MLNDKNKLCFSFISKGIKKMNPLLQLYELPPKEWGRRAVAKLKSCNNRRLTIDEILSSSKHMRPQRMYDYLSRYETIVARYYSWTPIDFTGRVVVELGAGPVLGWAPLAVFLGCAQYTCIDPSCNPAILEDPRFIRRYLLYVHKDLSALYGSRMTFETFLMKLRERIRVISKEVLETDLSGSFEVILSNSCLEHIFPLDATIVRLKSLSSPDCRFIHLVDFGSHRQGINPFNGMYIVEPASYFTRYGKNINLLRGPDVLQIF